MSPAALEQIGAGFEGRPPEEILRWGIETFAPARGSAVAGQNVGCADSQELSADGRPARDGIALATGFGPEGVVLMHLVSQIAPETTVFYLDTGLLFPETHALREALAARLGLRFTPIASDLSLAAQAEQYGANLWSYQPGVCCHLRKVAPLRRFLATQRAWITGIRRDQTAARAGAGLVEWDRANSLVKLNPLAAWTSAQVWRYLHAHHLPYNPLHDEGYPSIGCQPCTRPVAAGADPRSCRWMGFARTECGIHLQPQHP